MPRGRSQPAAPGSGVTTSVNLEPKHTFECKNNILTGITLGQWFSILFISGRIWHVDLRTYWLRVMFITLMACLNSLIATVEWLVYRRAVERAEINRRPVFVLGHPRTGTTLLHNLLVRDTKRFGFCNTFQAGFPSGFLLLERFSWLLSGIIDKTRPMDNMALGFDTPQEDELAINVLSGGISPYMPLAFMQQEEEYRKYFSFKESHKVFGIESVDRWTSSFMYLLRKLTLRTGDKRLVIKSPVHTARVSLLLQLFPEAQFIYIYRNPYVVVQSAINMADKTYWYTYLNIPTKDQILEFIFNQYLVLFDEYMADKNLIPDGNLVEIRFEDFECDLVKGVENIYKTLGWDGFESGIKQSIEDYVDSIKGYRKNKHKELPNDLRNYTATRLARVFQTQKYQL